MELPLLCPLSCPRHETKLPASNYIISVDENLSKLNKKVIKETLACESHISLTLWIACVAKVTRQAGDARSGRRDLKRDWVLDTHCRKHQLWERPAQNRGVLMRIGNRAVLGIRIGWKPLWWLINLHCCQELSLALVGQPAPGRGKHLCNLFLQDVLDLREEQLAPPNQVTQWTVPPPLEWPFWGHKN